MSVSLTNSNFSVKEGKYNGKVKEMKLKSVFLSIN